MGEKYPFVRQITNCDCGAACVSMVLKKINKLQPFFRANKAYYICR